MHQRVPHKFHLEAQDVGDFLRRLFPVDVRPLAEHVEAQDGALPRIDPVSLKIVEAGPFGHRQALRALLRVHR